MNCSVIIATYGDEKWSALARGRALPSARPQDPLEVIVAHDSDWTIARARNGAVAEATQDWLLFLDADDELAPGYLDAMTRAVERERHDGTLLLTPAVSFVVNGRQQRPHFQKEQPLRDGNWLTIGTLIPRALFQEVGGFREWGLYEDWDLWARCEMAGARIVKVPDAVYLAHYSSTSRNRSKSRSERNYWHQAIGHDLWPDYYDTPSEEEHAAHEVAGVRKLALA